MRKDHDILIASFSTLEPKKNPLYRRKWGLLGKKEKNRSSKSGYTSHTPIPMFSICFLIVLLWFALFIAPFQILFCLLHGSPLLRDFATKEVKARHHMPNILLSNKGSSTIAWESELICLEKFIKVQTGKRESANYDNENQIIWCFGRFVITRRWPGVISATPRLIVIIHEKDPGEAANTVQFFFWFR